MHRRITQRVRNRKDILSKILILSLRWSLKICIMSFPGNWDGGGLCTKLGQTLLIGSFSCLIVNTICFKCFKNHEELKKWSVAPYVITLDPKIHRHFCTRYWKAIILRHSITRFSIEWWRYFSPQSFQSAFRKANLALFKFFLPYLKCPFLSYILPALVGALARRQ